jgi:hypothetical protein
MGRHAHILHPSFYGLPLTYNIIRCYVLFSQDDMFGDNCNGINTTMIGVRRRLWYQW